MIIITITVTLRSAYRMHSSCSTPADFARHSECLRRNLRLHDSGSTICCDLLLRTLYAKHPCPYLILDSLTHLLLRWGRLFVCVPIPIPRQRQKLKRSYLLCLLLLSMLKGSTGKIEERNSTKLYIVESSTRKACLSVSLYLSSSRLKVAGLGVS